MAFFERHGVTLYFPGPLVSAKSPKVVAATKDLLQDLGIPFVMCEEIVTSGFHAWYAGHEQAFSEIKEKVEAILKKKRIGRIITNDPHEALTFRQQYAVEAVHILEVLDEHLPKITRQAGRRVSYHHACFLRKLGIPERVPLRILRRAGFHVPSENKPIGCCGSVGDDYARNNAAHAKQISLRRAQELPEEVIVVACPYCARAFGKRKTLDIVEVLSEV